MNNYALQNIVYSRERVKAGNAGNLQKTQIPQGDFKKQLEATEKSQRDGEPRRGNSAANANSIQTVNHPGFLYRE
jgi:hypothetical protein